MTAWRAFDVLRAHPQLKVTVASVGDRKAPAAFEDARTMLESVAVNVAPESAIQTLVADIGREVIEQSQLA